MMRNTMFIFMTLPLIAWSEAQERQDPEPNQEEAADALADQIRVYKLRHELLDATKRKEIPYLKDFIALYPESVVRYLSFAKADFPSLSVNTTLHDRYQLNMRIPVRYSEDNKKIIGYGEPLCYLSEISSVTPRDDGAGGTELGGSSGGDLYKHFGLQDWKKLVEAKGDFASLGLKLEVNKSVPNFNLVKKHLKSLERKIPKQADPEQPAPPPETKSNK
ncbi:hypothetical protein Rhal01_02607 [Rubritalea halochordaticola]|uniref:Uncharacterized protein n=2 Tax=Rubritalea halochordaticola TaxID=714537 RepID=A0ABP9V153_9BACT